MIINSPLLILLSTHHHYYYSRACTMTVVNVTTLRRTRQDSIYIEIPKKMEKANVGNDETGYKYRIELAGHGSEHIASRDDGSRYSDADSLKKKETLPPVSKAEIIKELPVIVRCIAKVLCLFEKDSHPIKKTAKIFGNYYHFCLWYFILIGLTIWNSDGSVTSKIRLSNISAGICFCIYGPMSIISIQKYFYDSVGRARFLDSWRSISFSARQKARSYSSRSFWGWFVYFLVSVVNIIIIFCGLA